MTFGFWVLQSVAICVGKSINAWTNLAYKQA